MTIFPADLTSSRKALQWIATRVNDDDVTRLLKYHVRAIVQGGQAGKMVYGYILDTDSNRAALDRHRDVLLRVLIEEWRACGAHLRTIHIETDRLI